jgi:hypothetical protein
MMPVIRVSQETYERLGHHARPFEDKPEDVVRKALDALEEKLGRGIQEPVKPLNPAKAEGPKLPQKAFRAPLLEAIAELGGSAHVSEIRALMETKLNSVLSDADRQPVSNGDPRWWNATCWERDALVKEGVFAKGSARGVWAMADLPGGATTEELNQMGKEEFERWVFENWAEERPNFRPRTFVHPTALVDNLPVALEKLVEQLNISQGQLVEMIHTGKLVRPRRTEKNKVEWSRAELMAAMPAKNWRP